MLYAVSTCLIKLAFSITLLRILDRRIYSFATYTVYAVMLVALIPTIFFVFWTLNTCKPISYLWEQLDPTKTGKCAPMDQQLRITYVQSALFFICDTTLAIIPAFLLWKLRLSPRTKVSAGILLGLGAM
jgi:hypothetical protein